MPIKYDDKYVLRPGHQVEYTREMIQELQKCAQSVTYFAENYYTIVHPIEGKQLIKLYDYQKEMIDVFKNNKRSIVLSGRQLGKTTCSCIYLVWFSIFNTDKEVAILANKQTTAAGIVSDIKTAYELLPPWMKPGVKKYDSLSVSFDNGTHVYARATSVDALRGDSVSLLFIDEASFIPSQIADDFWVAQQPTLATGGSVIIVSTPNGAAGLYYDLWQKAQVKDSGWGHLKVSWDRHPDRDKEWHDQTLQDIGKIKFSQEHSCVQGASLINVKYNNKIYSVKVKDLYEKGKDVLQNM